VKGFIIDNNITSRLTNTRVALHAAGVQYVMTDTVARGPRHVLLWIKKKFLKNIIVYKIFLVRENLRERRQRRNDNISYHTRAHTFRQTYVVSKRFSLQSRFYFVFSLLSPSIAILSFSPRNRRQRCTNRRHFECACVIFFFPSFRYFFANAPLTIDMGYRVENSNGGISPVHQ